MFAEPTNREFFISVGRDVISKLLLNAQKVKFILCYSFDVTRIVSPFINVAINLMPLNS